MNFVRSLLTLAVNLHNFTVVNAFQRKIMYEICGGNTNFSQLILHIFPIFSRPGNAELTNCILSGRNTFNRIKFNCKNIRYSGFVRKSLWQMELKACVRSIIFANLFLWFSKFPVTVSMGYFSASIVDFFFESQIVLCILVWSVVVEEFHKLD